MAAGTRRIDADGGARPAGGRGSFTCGRCTVAGAPSSSPATGPLSTH
jgi:hypothetical protein